MQCTCHKQYLYRTLIFCSPEQTQYCAPGVLFGVLRRNYFSPKKKYNCYRGFLEAFRGIGSSVVVSLLATYEVWVLANAPHKKPPGVHKLVQSQCWIHAWINVRVATGRAYSVKPVPNQTLIIRMSTMFI